MSYKAVNDITAIGGGGGLSSNLQTMALKLFDTFGYRRLGIRCKLRDEVCRWAASIRSRRTPRPLGRTATLSSKVPACRASCIVGHRRRVDWPTLVRRLEEATQGQGPVIRLMIYSRVGQKWPLFGPRGQGRAQKYTAAGDGRF